MGEGDRALAEVGEGAPTLVPRQATYVLDRTGSIEDVNSAFTAMLGWSPDDVIGRSVLSITHPDDHSVGSAAWEQLATIPRFMTRLRMRFIRRDGSWVWCATTARSDLDDAAHPCVQGEIIDISTEVEAEQALARREAMLDRLYRALPTGVIVLEPDGRVGAVNERWLDLVGPVADDPVGSLLARVVERAAVVAAIDMAKVRGEDTDLELSLLPGGVCQFATLHVRPLLDDERYAGLLLTIDDTTERRLHELAMAAQMRRDPLTGVLNRWGIEEALDERLASVGGPPTSVLYLDVDEFKWVNDRYGHGLGDRVLCEIANAIQAESGPAGVVGRLGGDEFLALIEASPTDVGVIAGRVRRRVDSLVGRFQLTAAFGVSIGRAECRPDDDFDSLVGRADVSMYDDKAVRRAVLGRDRRRLEIEVSRAEVADSAR